MTRNQSSITPTSTNGIRSERHWGDMNIFVKPDCTFDYLFSRILMELASDTPPFIRGIKATDRKSKMGGIKDGGHGHYDNDGKYHIQIQETDKKRPPKDVIDVDSQEGTTLPQPNPPQTNHIDVDAPPNKKSKLSHPGSTSRHFPTQLETISSKPIPRPSPLDLEVASRGLSPPPPPPHTHRHNREPFTETFSKSPTKIIEEFKEANRPKFPGQDNSIRAGRGLVQSIPGKRATGRALVSETECHLSWANLKGHTATDMTTWINDYRIQFTARSGQYVGSFKLKDVKVVKVFTLQIGVNFSVIQKGKNGISS